MSRKEASSSGARVMVQMRAVNSLIQSFEDEVKGTVASTVDKSGEVDHSMGEAITATEEVEGQAKAVSSAAEGALANVQTVAAATEELAASEHQLEELMHKATTLAATAVERAEHASSTVTSLLEASKAINGIVVFIEDIARRTNMLALNATIEAQRAGAAGRGFAVVAGEVKALANQTAGATRDIRDKIAGILTTTTNASEAISSIGETVAAIHQINDEAAQAVRQQDEATREISRSAQETTSRVSEVTSSIGMITDYAGKALNKSSDVKKRSEAISADLVSLRTRLSAVLKARSDSEQMAELPVDMPSGLLWQDQRLAGRLIRITPREASLILDEIPDRLPSRAALELKWPGAIAGDVQVDEDGVATIRFDESDTDTTALLKKLIESLDFLDMWVFPIVAEGADKAVAAFSKAVADGTISLSDLFDQDYQEIPGSNPLQHMTRFTTFCERVLPPIQEPLLALDKRFIAVCATDRNGYLPMNNLYCSKPQGADPVWNATNCRNRKILTSTTGKAVELASNPKERYVLTSYIREVSTGEMRMLRNLAMPIRVQGRYWGAMHITYYP